ncbi:PREDICTED: FIP1[V]-like protein [Camelina sativa]|uniref:FIP1[V]-like protein n=1 Tax=Camelina sativa TaxID=90675 RepID=A0ABM0V9V5_CAMSA|nr:PREDICTED: FIP1[V]-like protein [Camelina sativa]
MEEDDEFGDLYSDVLPPFQPPVVVLPPPPPPHRSIDLNLRSQDQDVAEANSAPLSRVSNNDAFKLSSITLSHDTTTTRPQAIGDGGGGDDKDMSFDIEEPDADSTPTIPGLFVSASEPGALSTDRGVSQVTTRIEQVGGGGGGGDGGQGEGDDWDSDSEDDLQIVLNESSRNVMIGGSRMGDNEDDDEDDDDEDPLVIVADTDPNQPMEEQLWGEDGLQGVEGDGKDGGEAGKGTGPGGVTGPPKAGYSSHGFHHPFHSQFKYVRPGAAPIPGGAPPTGGTTGQVRPPANLGPMVGRGRGDWRPQGMRNASAPQKGFHQSWGSNTAGRGLDFTLPSHKTIFEVDIESFEEKPWRYQGVEMTDYFNFGLNEESWKDYCKQLDQHRIETTMQSRIRVYESGRTDQGYDPDLPPELAAATGAQGVPVDSSNVVKPDSVQGDSAKVPANVRPSLPPGRPIPVETGSGERLPSIDTRAPRMRDLDAIIEIVCHDPHEDEPSGENGADQADSSLPGENVPVETSYVQSRRPDSESAERSPAQDEPHKDSPKKQDDEISRSTADSGQSFRSSSPVGDRGTRSSSVDREDVGGEVGKDAEMEEEHKMSSTVPQSAVQEDDGGESKTERSSESSKARSGNHRDYQRLKDGAEEEVIQDKHYARPANNRNYHDNNAPHESRKNPDRGKEMERTRAPSKGGRENSIPHMELDSSHNNYSIANREDFDKRKERDVDGGVWHRKEDDPYSRRGGDEGSRKRNHEDDPGSRQRSKMRDNEIRSKDDHIPSRKHMDDVARNTYEVDDHISKRRKDEEYLRRSRPEKNEITYGQRESISRLKRERDDRLEHQKRDFQHKIRDDFDDHISLRHRDDFYMQRDGNERLREREDLDKLKLTHEDGLSARGRERQVAVRPHRGSEDRSSRMKDEYKVSDKDHFTKDTTRHTKQAKRRDYPGEESSSHHRGYEDFSARADDIVSNEKKPRQERTGAKSDKVIDTLDGQRLQDRKHKDSRRKNKEQREGTESLRSKQGEQNGNSVVTGSKGTSEARNSRSEIPQQPNAKRHKENASSGDELHDSKKGRTKLERWASHKERDDAVSAKSSSVSTKLQENEKNTNGRLNEPVPGSIGKNRDVSEEKSGHDLAETKDGSEKGPGDRHLDTVEKLKKRSERFRLPMPTEKDTTGVKRMESETLPSAKIEGPVDSEVKVERPARKRRWTSS